MKPDINIKTGEIMYICSHENKERDIYTFDLIHLRLVLCSKCVKSLIKQGIRGL